MISLADIDVEQIIAVPVAFKNKLRIEDKSYIWLSKRERLADFLLAGAGAGAGAGAASSAIVASTFFAPTGVAAWLGLATAATPVGWVLASAVATGGTVLLLAKMLTDKAAVAEIVPRHINTPLDLLAQSLMELLGALAVRVATVDDELHPSELRTIGDVLHGEWGYDRDYITKAVASLTEQVSHQTVPTIVGQLQDFLEANPDCNREAMNDDLMEFVREIVGADGIIRPEEEQALHEIAAAFATACHGRSDQSSTSG
jgi:tellurite resistance protein